MIRHRSTHLWCSNPANPKKFRTNPDKPRRRHQNAESEAFPDNKSLVRNLVTPPPPTVLESRPGPRTSRSSRPSAPSWPAPSCSRRSAPTRCSKPRCWPPYCPGPPSPPPLPHCWACPAGECGAGDSGVPWGSLIVRNFFRRTHRNMRANVHTRIHGRSHTQPCTWRAHTCARVCSPMRTQIPAPK